MSTELDKELNSLNSETSEKNERYYARKGKALYNKIRKSLVLIENHRKGYKFSKEGDEVKKMEIDKISNKDAYHKQLAILQSFSDEIENELEMFNDNE